jgi:WD40 repeat protein
MWRLSDLPSSTPVTRIVHKGETLPLTFDAHGRWLITAGEDDLRLWEMTPGGPKEEPIVAGLPSPAVALAISNGGSLVVSGHEDGSVRGWDMTSDPERFKPVLIQEKADESIFSLSISPDSRWVAAGGKSLLVWETAADGLKTSSINPSQQGPVLAVAFSSNGRWLAAAGGTSILGGSAIDRSLIRP